MPVMKNLFCLNSGNLTVTSVTSVTKDKYKGRRLTGTTYITTGIVCDGLCHMYIRVYLQHESCASMAAAAAAAEAAAAAVLNDSSNLDQVASQRSSAKLHAQPQQSRYPCCCSSHLP